MALNDRKISTKPDPKRAAANPQHSRGYSGSRGGWTVPAEKPKPQGK